MFGAQVIRVEDPVEKGLWDIVRRIAPRIDEDYGPEGGSGFNNHNVEKLGVTINLRTDRGKELLGELVRVSNAVTENFSAGVMDRLGFGYERLRELRPDVVYVSNSGFGHTGPYRSFKSWGPIAQAMGGLTHTSGLPGHEPAGWGYSFMDHSGAYLMAVALLAALYHQRRTGEGQWVDIACAEGGIALAGLAALDASVNGRAERDMPVDSNRSASIPMAPHGIYRCSAPDTWAAVSCRDDADWRALADVVGTAWAADECWSDLEGRLSREDDLDRHLDGWSRSLERDDLVRMVRAAGVPCAPVLRPEERCDGNPDNEAWGLWPVALHSRHGPIRVDGLPVHMSATGWKVSRGGPLLGEDNERVLGEVLGLSTREIAALAEEGVI
jgi:crotonobetainyl-CoA:carnitine CoA-transferase CaiB-like acyl-CoA transferase